MKQKDWMSVDNEKLMHYIKNMNGKIVLGIDGFIDQVWQIVETRTVNNEFILIDKMQKFGELILNRKEGGMANEVIKKRRSFGGFTANTGRVTGNLDLSTVLIGMYGKEAIDKIFDELKAKCTLITVGDPVISNIFEFTDGKIMLPYLDELLNFTWNDLVRILGEEQLKAIFAGADIVSLGYWSNMPAFDEFIINLDTRYFSGEYPKRMFFDFANIKKRSIEAIRKTFCVLGALNKKIPMTLSLNEHEGALLFSYYDLEFTDDCEKIGEFAELIRSKINFDEIIIHTPNYAVAVSETEGTGLSRQDYCTNPVITTGAGDTFNGGYIAACLGDLNITERLSMANAATRFYISNGYSPGREELRLELERMKKAVS